MNINLTEFAYHQKQKYIKHRETFYEIFHQPLNKFWHIITGFDVIEFDRFINPKENESTQQAVKCKYGKEAVTLVKNLL